jgi:hypothetical protein
MISFIVLAFFSCHKSDPVPNSEPVNKYFNPNDLLNLKLDSVPNFWGEGGISYTSDFVDGFFQTYPGFVKSFLAFGNPFRILGISAFNSKDIAIEAMEARINNEAGVIQEGNSDAIKGKWWFGEGGSNIVFVNKWNTIIEVEYEHSNFIEVEDILYKTAAEIAQRVDKLSSVIE